MEVYTKNFPYTYFKFELDPTHNLTEDDPRQLVRFQMQTDQYIDLDTAYLEVVISVADYDTVADVNGVGYKTTSGTSYGIALDGPATSLISNFKFYQNGQLLEHIPEYDKIGQIMHTLNIKPKQRDGKSCLGLGKGGYSNKIPKINTQGNGHNQQVHMYYNGTSNSTYFYSAGFVPSYAIYPVSRETTGTAMTTALVNHGKVGPKYIDGGISADVNDLYEGKAANRTPYSLWSRLYGGDYGIQKADHRWYNFAINSANCYNSASTAQYSTTATTGPLIVERGYQIPFCPLLENPNKDILLEPGHAKYLINNGKYQQTPLKQDQFIFKVPLLSSIIGSQRSGHQGLVNGRDLGQMHLEWRFNEFAFYTTGLTSEDLGGGVAGNCFKRSYKIKRCRMIFDTYHPSYTPADALGPSEFWAHAWTIGHCQMFNSTALLNADHQINVGIKSARFMLTYFNLCDYLDANKTFCRKFYPISGNITSYQIKMNSLLFPVNPVIGHSGNPFISSVQQTDNTEFVDYFNRAMGTFMTQNRQIWTDNISFAPNERPYNTGNDLVTLNYEKVGGGVFFLEQKIPRCFYITRFDDQDGKFVRNMMNFQEYDWGWNGLDTTQYRPFTLSLRSDQINYNATAPIELNILFYHDVYVKLGPGQIETQGLMLQ